MPTPPSCPSLGRHCRELDLTLRIADVSADSVTLQDAVATWLLGHTERLTFGTPYVDEGMMLVDVTLHVGCKHLRETDGLSQCAVLGHEGQTPRGTQPSPSDRPRFARGGDRHLLSFRQRRRVLALRQKKAARRALPVAQSANPCLGAPCRTADNTRGAACCRDLTLEVVAPDTESELERLLRSRRSPYLCKVNRTDADTIECEAISACGYLDPDDGVSCVLHDRLLPNGRTAKPSICWEWPDIGPDEVTHPGCALA